MAMVESLRATFIGSQTRPTNDYTWCNETAAVAASINHYLPELEIDQTPFTYRQQFQSQVGLREWNEFVSARSNAGTFQLVWKQRALRACDYFL